MGYYVGTGRKGKNAVKVSFRNHNYELFKNRRGKDL